MKKKLKIQLTLVLILLLSIAVLFQVKNRIRLTEKTLMIAKNELIKAEHNHAILKAEYAHLSDPQKINKLIRENLNLRLVRPEDIIDS